MNEWLSNCGRRTWRVVVRSTSFRAVVGTQLTTIGTAYSAGQPLKPLIVAGIFGMAAIVITKCFDEELQREEPKDGQQPPT